jgi:hypothetical protein
MVIDHNGMDDYGLIQLHLVARATGVHCSLIYPAHARHRFPLIVVTCRAV